MFTLCNCVLIYTFKVEHAWNILRSTLIIILRDHLYQLMSDSQIRCSNVLFVNVHLLGTKNKSYLQCNSLTSVICFFRLCLFLS